MKKAFAVAVVCGFAVAWAAEPVVCAVTVSSAAATTTAAPASGTCSWQKGSTVLLQCGNIDGGGIDVYVDTQKVVATYSVLSDGGLYYDGGSSGGAATAADQRIDFSSNRDPYILYLDEGDQHVSMLPVDGTGTCKVMTTRRPKSR